MKVVLGVVLIGLLAYDDGALFVAIHKALLRVFVETIPL
jgi:hypothetical protein